MSSDRPGRVVFIGNIPYGLTEEQIIAIFSSVGQVLNFRLVYDQDTGKPKGFGFAEFADTDAAASAVRNLDKHQIMGRELRVDYSHVGGKDDTAPANYQAQPQQQQQQGYPPSSNGIGPLPPGAPLPHGLTCPDAISQTLNTLPVPQLLDILSQMKGYVMNDPAKATELLKQAPQLSYAIMQALLLMGLVDTNILATVVEQAAAPVPAPAPVPTPQQYPAAGQAQFPGYPPMPGQGFASTPPTQHPVYPPPPPQAVSVPPSQEELIKTVLALPQAQIDAMPPNERNAIMAIRYQHGGGRF